jgi:hypothetical protein
MDTDGNKPRRISLRLLYEPLRRELWGNLEGMERETKEAIAHRFAGRVWAMQAGRVLTKILLMLVRLPLLLIDLLVRWLLNFVHAIVGDRGWLTVASTVAGYLVVYGLVDARHQREENQVIQQRNIFITFG